MSGDESTDPEEKMNARLEETGERARLEEFLQLKLYECGWRAQVKSYCQELVRQQGLNNLTVDGLIDQVNPKARELVPDDIKRELVQRIRDFLIQQNDMDK